MKKIVFLLLCAASVIFSLALAEPAKVQTPGGPVNMRKKDSAKSTIVAEVPNRSMVEAEEIGDTWTKITYNKKTGYVKTEFLLFISSLTGKTVYPEAGEAAIAYAAPNAEAPIIAAFNSDEAIAIRAVEGAWAVIDREGEPGYIAAEALLGQRTETAGGKLCWIPQEAAAARDTALQISAGETQTLPAGTQVKVCQLLKDGRCLVHAPQGWGYAAQADLRLAVYADEAVGLPEGISAVEAAAQAEASLRKQYKQFVKQQTYCVPRLHGETAYCCGFFSDEDRLLYAAVVDGQGNVLIACDYGAFAAPDPDADLLPEGEMEVVLSADSLAVGQVLDIAVSAWTRHECRYTLTGPLSASCEPGAHFTAAWRPREAGAYTLTVTVKDQAGRSESREFSLQVREAGGEEEESPVYSQKDGWWLDKAYRTSTLDQSGCAIFTLSHALHRMGKTGADTLPEKLAKTYALCLTPEGTNNERLIREAAAAFGFKTKSALIKEEKTIRELLKAGAMFSFSIARGHIALVCGLSEDGTMARVMDSAPGATHTRIINDSLYYQTRSGSYRSAVQVDDIPGARWYFETGEYGGLEYWLRLPYVARRGVRLIQPGE